MVQQAKMIRQALGMVETIRMVSLEGLVSPLELVSSKTWISPYQKGKLRGSFQWANELKIDIVIYFWKAQDEPYKCYEDSVFYNGLQNIQFWPSRLLREEGRELDEMIWAELRGPLQRAYEIGSSIIICFRKAQDEPYKCYEDSVFYNRPQHIRIRPLSFWRAKTTVPSFMVFNSVRLFYFLLVYM